MANVIFAVFMFQYLTLDAQGKACNPPYLSNITIQISIRTYHVNDGSSFDLSLSDRRSTTGLQGAGVVANAAP